MDAITLYGPDGQAYSLHPLGTNALCALEERIGKNFGTVMGEIGALGIEYMRLSTVRIFLQTCMAEEVSEEEIGALIDHLGFDGISSAINGLIVPAHVKAKEEQRAKLAALDLEIEGARERYESASSEAVL